jgi:hypothetical protein
MPTAKLVRDPGQGSQCKARYQQGSLIQEINIALAKQNQGAPKFTFGVSVFGHATQATGTELYVLGQKGDKGTFFSN